MIYRNSILLIISILTFSLTISGCDWFGNLFSGEDSPETKPETFVKAPAITPDTPEIDTDETEYAKGPEAPTIIEHGPAPVAPEMPEIEPLVSTPGTGAKPATTIDSPMDSRPISVESGVPGPIVEGSFLKTGESYSFVVDARDDTYVEVTFSYPRESADFRVEIIGEDKETLLGDFDLKEGETVKLMGGGRFYLTIFSEAGSEDWRATYSLDVEETGIPPIVNPPDGSDGRVSFCEIEEDIAYGYLDGIGDSCEWNIVAVDDYFEVVFDYPRGEVDFWVEVVGDDHLTILGDFDLDDGSIIKLKGGGVFWLTIYSNTGESGSWSATW